MVNKYLGLNTIDPSCAETVIVILAIANCIPERAQGSRPLGSG